jgi:RimJ/RimL family protein N-acetyltransferase
MTVTIKKTESSDLANIMRLWNDGSVMKYVGFPDGLAMDFDRISQWFDKIRQSNDSEHYCIYSDEFGFCGETYVHFIEELDLAELDIKLNSHAQGKGIGSAALTYAINRAFTKVSRVCVDPDPQNISAIALYQRSGFTDKNLPAKLEKEGRYMELSKSEETI